MKKQTLSFVYYAHRYKTAFVGIWSLRMHLALYSSSEGLQKGIFIIRSKIFSLTVILTGFSNPQNSNKPKQLITLSALQMIKYH